MTEAPTPEQQTDRQNPTRGTRIIWLINIIFFTLIFMSAILVACFGNDIVIAITVVAFAASVLYIYLF